MAGVQPVFGYGLQISFTPVEAIIGGQVVEHRALGANAGKRACGVAPAASLRVAGVAHWDVPAARASIGGPQVGDEHALVVISNCVIPVTFAAAAVEGDLLIAAAGGQVTPTPAVTTPTAADVTNTRAIIGRAYQAVAAGAVGLARITV